MMSEILIKFIYYRYIFNKISSFNEIINLKYIIKILVNLQFTHIILFFLE